MLKKTCLLLFVSTFLFLSCSNLASIIKFSDKGQPGAAMYVESSMQEQSNAGLWFSGPLNGQFIIIGVSPRLVKADDEIMTAREDAARKAAMFNGLQGKVEITNATGSGGFFDYSADSKLDLVYNKNFQSYYDSLTFDPEKDVIRITGTTLVRFKYNTSSVTVNYVPVKASGRPSWVNGRHMPEFDGYTTVVGYAGKRRLLSDTIFASYESAAARLIEVASTRVGVSEKTGTGTFVGSTTAIHTVSQGSLSNFQVLAFWLDPNGSVATLAIARVSK